MSGVKNAPDDLRALTSELDATLKVLERMLALSAEGSGAQQFPTLKSLVCTNDSPYLEYKRDLVQLQEKLKKNVPENWRSTVWEKVVLVVTLSLTLTGCSALIRS
jgi:hypothetical protein